ncbi:aldo/keto reductase [Sphaerisporangium album]|uniref:Aldo/keto reductase n=1 Tax=Sphaerisporangium album TaxID=509200 RepID=A0A367EIM4_9ACTN|nr:aldo/keto reductase [Sphaerisporangium album]RCG17924.1 aldo/keto reductase [Sphaerisporangium album]
MQYTQLGHTGLRISSLVLGAWNFGKVTNEHDSHMILDTALEAGINVVDTANKYGRGTSEEIIGRWLALGSGRREKLMVATKVFGDFSDWPNDGRLSARHIRKAAEDSLRRLRTDHIDLYQMHHVDRCTPWQEIWQAMDILVAQGKVIYVGSSNHAGWHIAQGQESALRRHRLGLASEQCLYNLAERTAEQEVIPAARNYGLGVLAWSPLHGGMLGGILATDADPGGRRRTGRAMNSLPRLRDQVQAYEDLCTAHSLAPAEVALAWVLSRPEITAPIIGPRTVEHLTSALRALDMKLETAVLHELDRIFPGPGPAPESFAW